MSGVNIPFLVIGVIAFLIGIAMMAAAVRGRPGESPKSTALLIAGMMATAFGMLMTGFAFAVSAAAEPAR